MVLPAAWAAIGGLLSRGGAAVGGAMLRAQKGVRAASKGAQAFFAQPGANAAAAAAQNNPGLAQAQALTNSPFSAFASQSQRNLVAQAGGGKPANTRLEKLYESFHKASESVNETVESFQGLNKAVSDSPVGKFASGISDAAKSIIEANKRFEEFKGELLQSGKALSVYNGRIASAYAQLEIGDIGRGLKSGQATAASTEYLTASENRLRDQWRPFEDFGRNFWNNGAGFINDFKAAGLSVTSSLLSGAADIASTLAEYAAAARRAITGEAAPGAAGEALRKKYPNGKAPTGAHQGNPGEGNPGDVVPKEDTNQAHYIAGLQNTFKMMPIEQIQKMQQPAAPIQPPLTADEQRRFRPSGRKE